jgi:hypothetical protein
MTPAELNMLRTRADPLADDAVAALASRPGPKDTVLERVRQGAGEGDRALAAFVSHTDHPPPWADFPAMEAGRRAAMRHAPLTFLVLLTDGLIESFAIPHGARVLARTGRLERDTIPRLYETAAMVRDLLLESGARPGHEGHTALLRVRLLHAHVRRFVGSSAGWDPAVFGQPVNQMDMAHTLMMFSLVLARGIEALGASLTDEEKDSWCQLWRYAGYMLGVDERVLFTNLAEERALYALIREHHYRPDDVSRSLSFAVLDSLAGQPPFFLPKPALYAIARRLLGDALADDFGLPRSRRWSAFVSALVLGAKGTDRIAHAAPMGQKVALAGGHAFVELHRWRVLRQGNLAGYVFRTSKRAEP